jgi:glyoxylase-like metal-dependent hydrolase (beta-lactamase superfamily II)
MWRDEWDFWISEPKLAELKIDERIKELLVAFALKNLRPIQGQLDLVDDETEIVSGIRVFAAPGHTPGHMAVSISSDGDSLLCISDVVLLQIHLEQPDWYAAVDFAPQQAVTTRRQLLDRAAAEEALVLAFHFPFPGLGYVTPKEGRWQWQPVEMRA